MAGSIRVSQDRFDSIRGEPTPSAYACLGIDMTFARVCQRGLREFTAGAGTMPCDEVANGTALPLESYSAFFD